MPSHEEIEEAISKCSQAGEEGSRFPGMSYEEGVRYAIEWLEEDGPNPFED